MIVGPEARLLRGQTRGLLVISGSSVLGGLLEAAFLVSVTRLALDLSSGESRASVPLIGSMSASAAAPFLVLLLLLRLFLAVVTAKAAANVTAGAVAGIRTRLARAYLFASWPAQQESRAGQLQELLTSFTQRSAELVASTAQGLTAAFSLIAMLGLALAVDPLASLFAIVGVAALGSLLRPLRSAVRRQAASTAEAGMEFATAMGELSSLGLEVNSLGVQSEIEVVVRRHIGEFEQANRRLIFLRGMIPAAYAALAYGVVIAVLAVLEAGGSDGIASVSAVMLVMLRSLSYGQALQGSLASIASTRPSVELLQAETDRYESASIGFGGVALVAVEELRLENVGYTYDGLQSALDEVTCNLGGRGLVAVIGPSGGGKSTLVQLLLRLRRPTKGQVLVNGQDAQAVDPRCWSKFVSLVPQSTQLIEATVADNIRFFRPNIDDDRVVNAAKLAHLHEDVVSLEGGYDRFIGAGGAQLSGGQQQRLSLARALVCQPQVLVLDEPTSALDMRSEQLVLQTLVELSRDLLVVVVAHRTAVLEVCDRVLVLVNGRLEADGTVEQIAARNPSFLRIVENDGPMSSEDLST